MAVGKTQRERLWLLLVFERGGWHNPPVLQSAKKWQAHLAKLLKEGLLEKDPEYKMYRLTEAGAKVIAEKSR